MPYALLADLVVFIHLLFIGFVVGGELLIVIGAFRRWNWVRNLGFRIAHVLAIVLVAVDSIAGILCPLTEWEAALRRRAGQFVEADVSFMGRLVRTVIYVELPGWAFTTIYVGFALLVIATLFLVPPRRRRRLAAQPADRK
ncbi:MAG: DUF2784 domain-containing protein [Planctomycetota bacterium]|jgi:hypothetical protein